MLFILLVLFGTSRSNECSWYNDRAFSGLLHHGGFVIWCRLLSLASTEYHPHTGFRMVSAVSGAMVGLAMTPSSSFPGSCSSP